MRKIYEVELEDLGAEEISCIRFRCPLCGDVMITRFSNYCPGCGAKIIRREVEE